MQGSKEMWRLASCSLFLLLLSGLDALDCTVKFRYSGFRGHSKIPPLVAMAAASKTVCAMTCESLAACKSFSFHARAENCSLFSRRIMAWDVDLTIPSEADHFSRVLASCPAGKGYVALPGTTKCIRMGNARTIWPQAAEVCAEDGGHLLIIENDDVMQKLQDFLPPGYWLVGFNDMDTEDQFLWLDRTPVNRARFAANEPSDGRSPGDEDCGGLWVMASSLGLDDLLCDQMNDFICSLSMEE